MSPEHKGDPTPLEAESIDETPLEAESLNEASPPLRPQRSEDHEIGPVIGAVLIILLLLMGAWSGGLFENEESEDHPTPPEQVDLVWNEPVWLLRDPDCVDDNGQIYPEYAIGYEPGLAVDSEGNMYYTAHKDLRWAGPNGGPGGWESGVGSTGPYACKQPVLPPYSNDDRDTSWDYYASWFMVSSDGGDSWATPPWGSFTEPTSGQDHGSMLYGGDEGDIAIDDNQRVYFLDTYLIDNWIHRWDDGGTNYIDVTATQGTMAMDDRPWLTGQGDGILHYLGNSGSGIPGCDGEIGRYWYYRSDDGGYTFSQCEVMPGGWSHIDAERDGSHVYILQETSDSNDADIQVRVSEDTGLSWSAPQVIGPREANPPEGFPWVSTGPADSSPGLVAGIWGDAAGGRTVNWKLHLALSFDYGQTWTHNDITPWKGTFFYPTVYVGPQNTVAIAFYGYQGPYEAGTPWNLYAAMVQDPTANQTFDFQQVDPDPLHVVNQWEVDNNDVHALHDFFEIAISPVDLSLNIAYQRNVGEHPFEDHEEQRYLMFVRGDWQGGNPLLEKG